MEPRNYAAGASGTPPPAPISPSNGYPASSVPGVSQATKPGPHWYYKIGEELRAIIVAAGRSPSDATLNQLLLSMGDLYADKGSGLKALVNFNGTTTTPTIRASKNISSVTKISTGRYQITMSSAPTGNTNYSVFGTTSYSLPGNAVSVVMLSTAGTLTSTSFEIHISETSSTNEFVQDELIVNVAVFG